MSEIEKLSNFLLLEARQRRSLLRKDGKTPNGAALAKKIGVNQATARRWLNGLRNTVEGDARKRPPREFQLTYETKKLIARAFGYKDVDELSEAIEKAPPQEPMPAPKRRPRRKGKSSCAMA